ncbi:MAG: hypothetical protein DRO73_00135 [Candidatus Thorarchaeota archaeon]|nr:MAG: hypothetical protein DRO73_00135 [Candidatus Thorarchaeota archaeon]RLI53961.1 MAG: hypothetical protein DRO93_13105 [Candidatus Thorarchaeota archaeon]
MGVYISQSELIGEAPSMSVLKDFVGPSDDGVARRFERYLNGPLGKRILESLEDNETFIMRTSAHTLEVTKKKDRVTVRVVGTHSDNAC